MKTNLKKKELAFRREAETTVAMVVALHIYRRRDEGKR
jgi:hypothetical protein